MKQEEIAIFWKKAFKEEASNSFNNDEMNNVMSFVNDISKRGNISLETHYKNFYNILIVLKANNENNKSLHENFIDHLQKRYVDHWDWANKYQKEDDDMHYYGLYCECRNKIEAFINDKYKSESEAQRALYTNTFNKYLSFLYILYNEIDKSNWEYNEKDVIKDKQGILELKANIENINCIKFGNKKTIATLRSKKLTKLISENFITYISKKIVFEPEDIQGAQEVEYKIQIINLIKSKEKFISAIVKASYSALIELGIETKKKHGIKELVYNIINTTIPDLFLNEKEIKEGLKGTDMLDFEKSEHIKSIARSLIKETFCLKYNDCNSTTLCKDFQPVLTYTDNSGEQKIITSFSDLF